MAPNFKVKNLKLLNFLILRSLEATLKFFKVDVEVL